MADESGLSFGQVVLVVVAIVAVSGSGVTYFLLIHQPQQRIAAAEETDATIVSSNVERLERSNDRDRFRPNITYRYTVDGQTYTSNNYFAGDETATFSQPTAQERADTFDAGRNVTVHVNPDNPQQAYFLERGPRQTDYLAVGVFGFLAAGSISRLFKSLRGG
jgi:type II secretory pathway pseudopilin PulG